jgi:hypothetical protein
VLLDNRQKAQTVHPIYSVGEGVRVRSPDIAAVIFSLDPWFMPLERYMNRGGDKPNSGSRSRNHHLGMEFLIWRRESTWFWFLINPRSQAGVIGATSDESRAVREARFSIEEILEGDGIMAH